MPYVLFVLTCLIWGASFLLMRWASALLNAPAISAGRMIGGMLALSVVWILLRRFTNGQRVWSLGRQDLPALGVVVLIGFVVPWTLQPYLIGRYQQSGLFGMMVSLVPLLTVVVSVPMLGERPSLRQGLGVLLGLVMVAVLFGDAVRAHGVPAWAMVLAVVVPLCYAVSNTWVKLRFHAVDSLLLSAVVMAVGALLMLPLARLNEVTNDVSIGKAIASVSVLGIVGSGLAMWMFYKMIQMRGPLFAGMVTYVVPGIAVLLGWSLEDEVVTRWQVLALIGIVVSVALVQWPRPSSVAVTGTCMRFTKESRIMATPREIFAFHESPHALAMLIPPWENMRVVESAGSLKPGSRVVLKGRKGIMPMKWVAVHTEYDPPHLFADRAESSPFSYWYHRHHILDDGQGHALLRDEVEFLPPLGVFGRVLGGWFILRQLEKMFTYRHEITRQAIESGEWLSKDE